MIIDFCIATRDEWRDWQGKGRLDRSGGDLSQRGRWLGCIRIEAPDEWWRDWQGKGWLGSGGDLSQRGRWLGCISINLWPRLPALKPIIWPHQKFSLLNIQYPNWLPAKLTPYYFQEIGLGSPHDQCNHSGICLTSRGSLNRLLGHRPLTSWE